MNDLNFQEEIESIKKQLISKVKPQKIILFGSAARNEFTENSDLDFLVIKEDLRRPLEVEQEIHRLIDYRLASDFIFLTPEEFQNRLEAGDFFLKEILAGGKVLYG